MSTKIKKTLNAFWNHIGRINGVLLILYFIFAFSTSVITNDNSKNFPYYLQISISFIFIIAFIVCPYIIRFLSKLDLKTGQPAKLLVRVCLYIIPLLSFLAFYFAYYPGAFSLDSANQLEQIVNNQYNDWHPVIQTLFALKLPLILSNGWIGSIILFQILFFSTALGYALNTIYTYTSFKYTLVAIAFILLNPQIGYTIIYPWKDVSFAIGTILLLAYSIRIFVSKGNWIKSPVNTILFIVVITLTSLFRHNAILFTLPLAVAVILQISKKRGVIISLSFIVLFIGIKYPLYSALGVEKPGGRQSESLGLPMNVIGAVVTYTPELLDEETRDFAYKVAPQEVWIDKYQFGDYNSVKFDANTNSEVIEEYGAPKIVIMMFKSMFRSKSVATTAFIKLTEPAYSITSDYDSFRVSYISPYARNLGISEAPTPIFANACESYKAFVEDYFAYPFLHLGFLHLVIVAMVLSKFKLNKSNDWKRLLFILPVLIYNFGSALLLSGVADASRLFFYTFPLMPFILAFVFLCDNDNKQRVLERNNNGIA